MGKKRLHGADGGGEAAGKTQTRKCWCYYCGQEAKDDIALIRHQAAKHFRCPSCDPKFSGGHCQSLSGLITHMRRSHNEELKRIPGASEGREDPRVEVYGMEGIPENATPPGQGKGRDAAKEDEDRDRDRERSPRRIAPVPLNTAPRITTKPVAPVAPTDTVVPKTGAQERRETRGDLKSHLDHLKELLAKNPTAAASATLPPAIPSFPSIPAVGPTPGLPAPGLGLAGLGALPTGLGTGLGAGLGTGLGALPTALPPTLGLGTLGALPSMLPGLPGAGLPGLAGPGMGACLGTSPAFPAAPGVPGVFGGGLENMQAALVLTKVWGKWRHSSGGEITVSPGLGGNVVVHHYLLGEQTLSPSAFVVGSKLKYCQHEGTVNTNIISWSNGALWTKIG